ncbi:MAG TPA: amino acid adenylation domain-containing protein [Clostridia bacterium]|nr:amino acid adenylation domain-containing protein [Clostridia bacterium]
MMETGAKGRNERPEGDISYWKEYLSDYEQDTVLPKFNKADKSCIYVVEEVFIELDDSLSGKLKKIALKHHVSMDTVVEAVWGIVLQKYNNTHDVLFGLTINENNEEKDEKVVPLRIKCNGDTCFHELLRCIETENSKAGQAGIMDINEVQSVLGQSRKLIDHIMVINKHPFGKKDSEPALQKITERSRDKERQDYDFSIEIYCESNICIGFRYNAAVFDRKTVEAAGGHFINAAQAVTEKVDIKICEIDILSEEEKNKLLFDFNNTKTEYPRDKTIHQLFEEQAGKTPLQLAVVSENTKLTYEELNLRANKLASILKEKGVESESIVAIMAQRSVECIIGMLAILKAGGAYLPIDPAYPDERKCYMLEDSGAKVLLTMSDLDPINGMKVPEIIFLDSHSHYWTEGKEASCTSTPDHLAYIMYTSGSTGKPKGTMVEHRNVVRLVKNTNYIQFSKDDRILQTGAIVFDACTFEIWGALLNGLSLYLTDGNNILDARKLQKVLVENKITILWLTSPLFNQLSDKCPEMFSGLKYLLVGGDTLSPRHINNVMEKCPKLKIINGYGPTENTTFSTCFPINRIYEENIPIGKPISNSTAYIVDKYNHLQPVGVFGELWVGGDGVGRGYLNRKDMTSEKFIDNPFIKGDRIYKTGDLARWLPDGNIDFLGRADNQVKIRGFRIELGEIENQLMKHDSIKEAVVIDKTNQNNGKFLCAYFVSDNELTVTQLKEHMLNELPSYMVPSYFTRLEKMPLTPNGKIDRKKLPEPDTSSINTGVEFVPPRNKEEEALAQIWCEVLGLSKVSIEDNFFNLGGDSIKAVEVTARAAEAGTNISTSDIFRCTTIKGIMDSTKTSESKESTFDQFAAVQQKYNLKDYQVQVENKGEDTALTGEIGEYPAAKELKVVIQKEITTYLHRSLPLCAILAYDKYLPWYYNNFIQIFSFTDSSGYVELNYLEPRDCFIEIADVVCLGYHLLKKEKSIIDFIIEKLNMGYYLVMNVDEFYLPNKWDYRKNHFVHSSLIYGYDNGTKQLKAVGFNQERLFTGITFSYGEFIDAYENGKIHYKNYAPWCAWSAVQLIKPKSFDGEFPFSTIGFIKELQDYLLSGSDLRRLYSFEYQPVQVEFGFKVYDVLLRNLQNLLDGKLTIDYRAIHLLSEHKKCLYDRLGYVISKNQLTGKSVELQEQYLEIVEQWNDIRLQYLAQSYSEFDAQRLTKEQKSMLHNVIEKVNDVKEKEYEVLQKVIEQLNLNENR